MVLKFFCEKRESTIGRRTGHFDDLPPFAGRASTSSSSSLLPQISLPLIVKKLVFVLTRQPSINSHNVPVYAPFRPSPSALGALELHNQSDSAAVDGHSAQ